ncbi:DsbA family protein [Tropicimonas sp.]|uniref:DsbA family protein n=1 Tax=Tropicimonas sp. TaxID=2067044 RepID=UPI003A8BD0D8
MKALPLAGLLAFGLALPAVALDLGKLSDSERQAFRAEVRAYLMDNPEVLMEAIQVLEQRQAEGQIAADVELVNAYSGDLFESGHDWIGGNPDGDVTIVEFVDYRCGYCRKAFPELEKLVETDGNIRLILKEFPILGEQSLESSRFALAVREIAGDRAYKEAHDALIAFRGDVDEAGVQTLADRLGLDGEAIVAAMESPEIDAIIAENHALGQRMQISGTPTFVVGGQLLRGYLPYEDMQQVVDQERSGG